MGWNALGHLPWRRISTPTAVCFALAPCWLVSQGHRDGINLDRLPEPLLGSVRPWTEDIASGDHRGFFLRAPVLIDYLIEHRESVPLFIPDELDDAGLNRIS